MNRPIATSNFSAFNSDNRFQSDRSGTSALSRLTTVVEEGSSLGMNLDQPSADNDDVSNKGDKQAMVPLPEDFQPGADDVLCGRGKK